MTKTSLGQVDASSNYESKESSMPKSKKEPTKSPEGKANKPKEANKNGFEETQVTPKKSEKPKTDKKVDLSEKPKESKKNQKSEKTQQVIEAKPETVDADIQKGVETTPPKKNSPKKDSPKKDDKNKGLKAEVGNGNKGTTKSGQPQNVHTNKEPSKKEPSNTAPSKKPSSKKKGGLKAKHPPAKTLDAYTLARNDVMIEYSPLVRMVAYKIAAKLPPSVDVNDLISTGYLGLIDAFKRFDKSKNVKFKTYAEIRVAGAIQDELRSMDWLPRSVRDTIKKIERAREDVEKRLGNNTSEEDVASQMGVGIDEYQEAIGRVKNLSLVSIDDCFVSGQGEKGLAIHEKFADSTSVDPYTTIHAKKIREHLIRHISRLSEEHRAILGIYYFEEMSLREIGRIFNVSESRISQLHTQAIIKVWTDLRRSLRHDKLNEAD